MDIDSILNLYKKTYLNLPRPVKSFLGNLYGSIPLEIRFGGQYRIHKKIVETFENSSDQFQMDFMYNKTFETLQFAYENIPHYTQIFNESGFSPTQFKSLGDLKKVPFLTKQMIQNNLKNLYTNKIERPVEVHTGGSTFTPTKFFLSLKTSRAKERAYNNFIFSKLGYTYGEKTLVIRASDTSDEKNNIFWEYERVSNQLWLSSNHINKKYIKKLLLEVEKFQPKFVWGYPSAISFFVNECKKIGIQNIEGVSGVFLTSEIIFPEQREAIASFFKCKVLSHYGHRESSTIGYRIDGEKYNFLNSYGVTRIVNDEIVATSFDNFVMPFINYKTQDYISGSRDYLDQSDMVFNVENIEGRLQDFIVTKDGTIRTAMSIGMGHAVDFENIKAAQYYQDTIGKITIFLESDNPEKVNVERLIADRQKFVKNSISFDVKFVDKIEKTALGKWKTCIQKLDIEKYK